MTDEKQEEIGRTQTLTVKSASLSDRGMYSCAATNEIGTGHSLQAELKVKCE